MRGNSAPLIDPLNSRSTRFQENKKESNPSSVYSAIIVPAFSIVSLFVPFFIKPGISCISSTNRLSIHTDNGSNWFIFEHMTAEFTVNRGGFRLSAFRSRRLRARGRNWRIADVEAMEVYPTNRRASGFSACHLEIFRRGSGIIGRKREPATFFRICRMARLLSLVPTPGP